MPTLTATIYLNLCKYPLKISVGALGELLPLLEAIGMTRIDRVVLEGFSKDARFEASGPDLSIEPVNAD